MPDTDFKILKAQVPVPLADKLDQLADRTSRSSDSIVTEALAAWIADEEERDRLTWEGLADTDAGRIYDHETIKVWVDSITNQEHVAPEPAERK